MTRFVVLDSGPLGLLTHSKPNPEAQACVRWLRSHLSAGTSIVVPEIADYEIRRELLRLGLTKGLLLLESILTQGDVRYLPINTHAIRRAAEYWAASGAADG